MSVKTIAEFKQLQIEILEFERMIEQKFHLFEKNQEIESGRCFDHGQRGFALTIYFDEMNLVAFGEKNLNEFRNVITKYKLLRDKQKKIETQLNAEYASEKQNLESIMKESVIDTNKKSSL